MAVRAVIFDLGGVVFPSPFEAFDAYDHDHGLPVGSVRGLIRVSSETGAWAALERGELTMTQFHDALESEAELAGFALAAEKLMQRVGAGSGARAAMVRAIHRLRDADIATAALRNNWIAPDGKGVVCDRN